MNENDTRTLVRVGRLQAGERPVVTRRPFVGRVYFLIFREAPDKNDVDSAESAGGHRS